MYAGAACASLQLAHEAGRSQVRLPQVPAGRSSGGEAQGAVCPAGLGRLKPIFFN